MQNIDTTFTWEPNKQQAFNSPGLTILKGHPETFNKMRGCGLDVYGIASDGTVAGPLILVPDASNESGMIDWVAPSTFPDHSHASFKFWTKADFRISGNSQLRTTSFMDGPDFLHENSITFYLYDDSNVTLEDLNSVILSMTSLETAKTPNFDYLLHPKFVISAEVVKLFNRAELLGYSRLDVQANLISTTRFGQFQSGGLFFRDNSGLVINNLLSQQVDSELRLLGALCFYDSSYAVITARTIYNDFPDNSINDIAAIEAVGNASLSIRTEQFLQGSGEGKIIQLSDNADVTIYPMNGIIPINLVEEMNHPTKKCWPGMINFKSGAKGMLRLVGNALQSNQSVSALNSLQLVYVDGKPVDIASNFNIDLSAGIGLWLK